MDYFRLKDYLRLMDSGNLSQLYLYLVYLYSSHPVGSDTIYQVPYGYTSINNNNLDQHLVSDLLLLLFYSYLPIYNLYFCQIVWVSVANAAWS